MKKQLKKILSDEIATHLTKYDFIVFALLFGSFAKDENRFLSDIDIAIYTNKKVDILTIGYLISELETHFEKKIDLVILNDLYKKNSKLSFNISDSHKIIFVKNEDEYINFKTQSLKYFFDMSYTYNMLDNEVKRRLFNGDFGKNKAS